MKCQWKKCTGIINPETERCLMCGRTLNISKEEMIDAKKAKIQTNWKSNSRESNKKTKLKRKYGST